MPYSPYGASGSIVVPPSVVRVSSTRIGSRRNWRLSDTDHGRAVRKAKPKAKYRLAGTIDILPALTESEQDNALKLILNRTREENTQPNNNIHDK